MGTFRPNLDGMDPNSEVFSLIERMLDMITEKDKKLSEMQDTIDTLREEEGRLKTSEKDKKRELKESQQNVEDLKSNGKQLTRKIEDQQKDIARYLKLIDQLTATQEQLKSTIDSLNTTIHSTILRKLVEEWRKGGKWADLSRGLKKALDDRSKAHQQLCALSKQHQQREPLREVCAGGSVALLQLLLDGGLPAGTGVGEGGDSMLHAAVGCMPSLQLLLGRGADLASRNSRGETPLLLAAKGGHVPATKELLSRGADPGARDTSGRHALHWAAWAGHLDISKMLLDAGVDHEVADGQNMKPIDLARSQGHQALVELLLSRAHRHPSA